MVTYNFYFFLGTYFLGGIRWHWLMLMSNLKFMSMKKQCRHLVVKALWSFGFLKYPFHARVLAYATWGKWACQASLKSFLVLFSRVFACYWWAFCTSLSIGASVVEALFDYVGITFGFLRASPPCRRKAGSRKNPLKGSKLATNFFNAALPHR